MAELTEKQKIIKEITKRTDLIMIVALILGFTVGFGLGVGFWFYFGAK